MTRIRHIFRWDLDKTYLKTEFDSVRDLVRTARLSAEERENIPGSAALIRAIRDCAPGENQHLVYFISGSPQQMRTVIEKKFALDGFIPDGFVLKPTVSNILRGRFRAVRNQVPYKLSQLLQGRSGAPIGTEETLFGDDAEADAFVYSLYADLLAGRICRETLVKILKKASAYRDQVRSITDSLDAVVHEDRIKRIFIHLDQKTPPVAFQPYFPRVVPIYNHLQTAIVLYLDGTLAPSAIRNVARELLARYGFDTGRLINLSEDILRRRRIHYPPEVLEKTATELTELHTRTIEDPSLPEAKLDQATKEVVDGIAERALHLHGRPLPEHSNQPHPSRDYLSLWGLEHRRREDRKRARKLGKKASSETQPQKRNDSKS